MTTPAERIAMMDMLREESALGEECRELGLNHPPESCDEEKQEFHDWERERRERDEEGYQLLRVLSKTRWQRVHGENIHGPVMASRWLADVQVTQAPPEPPEFPIYYDTQGREHAEF